MPYVAICLPPHWSGKQVPAYLLLSLLKVGPVGHRAVKVIKNLITILAPTCVWPAFYMEQKAQGGKREMQPDKRHFTQCLPNKYPFAQYPQFYPSAFQAGGAKTKQEPHP